MWARHPASGRVGGGAQRLGSPFPTGQTIISLEARWETPAVSPPRPRVPSVPTYTPLPICASACLLLPLHPCSLLPAAALAEMDEIKATVGEIVAHCKAKNIDVSETLAAFVARTVSKAAGLAPLLASAAPLTTASAILSRPRFARSSMRTRHSSGWTRT